MAEIEITGLEQAHRAGWETLYRGYAEFYRVEMNNRILDTVWGWLMDGGHELEGLAALSGGEAVGLAHYRRMPSPLRGADIGFLDDLYVSPEARGGKIGALLIQEIRRIAEARGWAKVRWITADDNYRARTLYDRVAVKTSWNLYELEP